MAKSIFSEEHKKAISNGLKGKPKSEETRQKMREAHARRKALKAKSVGVDAVIGGGE